MQISYAHSDTIQREVWSKMSFKRLNLSELSHSASAFSPTDIFLDFC